METPPMHRALLAVPLIASLLFPALWNLLQKEGPGWDPNGAQQKAGPGLDPNGFVAPTTTPSEAGPGLDPSGHS